MCATCTMTCCRLLNLHAYLVHSRVCRAALGVVEGRTRPIDVVSVTSPTKQAFLLVSFSLVACATSTLLVTRALSACEQMLLGMRLLTRTAPACLQTHIAWGIPGATARRNQIRRWPGVHRYDVSGILSLLKVCSG